jgi:hypothetical protein
MWAQEQLRDNSIYKGGYPQMDYNMYLNKNNMEYNNLLSMKQANNKISNYFYENPNLQYKLKGREE